jgi:riboflavin synthase
MFTGIIEEVGEVESLERRSLGSRLAIRCRTVIEDATIGASIAVNGVCVTATEFDTARFVADLSPETLDRSNLGRLRPGAPVNLERPVAAGGRLGGHIVQGHVDGVGELISIERLGGEDWWLRARVPTELDRYLAVKGSVAIDGVSLTLARVENAVIEAAVIPHTYRSTTLVTLRAGARLNIECDILAKYVEKLLGTSAPSSGLTEEKLRAMGY